MAMQPGIDAIIVANTTVSRPPLKSRYALETGGRSGAPMKSLALEALRQFRSASGGEIPLIGVGGIAPFCRNGGVKPNAEALISC